MLIEDALQENLVNDMMASGAVRTPAVEQAFRCVSRRHFLPHLSAEEAFRDEAIATHRREGSEESISSSSQPTMMAIMLEQLAVAPGMRVLEIGAGTGYNAALLAELIGDPARVWTVDVTEEFCAEAHAHLAAANKAGVHVLCADGWRGWPDAAPYDRIIVTASAYDIAPAWFEQLRAQGLLVVPWGGPSAMHYSLALQKRNGRLVQQSSRSCSFMPMRGEFALPAAEPSGEGAAWERPWNVPPPADFVPTNDLAAFLSLFTWPLQAIIFWQDAAGDEITGQLGLMDGKRIVAQAEQSDGWKMVGQGAASAGFDLEAYVHLWLRWGRPTLDRLQVTAYPRGSAPEPQDEEALGRREWFDYLVTPGRML